LISCVRPWKSSIKKGQDSVSSDEATCNTYPTECEPFLSICMRKDDSFLKRRSPYTLVNDWSVPKRKHERCHGKRAFSKHHVTRFTLALTRSVPVHSSNGPCSSSSTKSMRSSRSIHQAWFPSMMGVRPSSCLRSNPSRIPC
jgi:hypothetical protein